MSGQGGDQFENLQARDNARMHNGHNFNTTNYNYHFPSTSTRTQTIDEAKQHKLNGELVKAARTGQVPRLRYLLGRGADIDFEDGEGFEDGGYTTPLHEAVAHGHPNVVGVLIEAGADIHKVAKNRISCSESGDTRRSGDTPLHRAAQRGDQDMIRYLLERGANANLFCVTVWEWDEAWGTLPLAEYSPMKLARECESDLGETWDISGFLDLLKATDFDTISNIRVAEPKDIPVGFNKLTIWAKCIISTLCYRCGYLERRYPEVLESLKARVWQQLNDMDEEVLNALKADLSDDIEKLRPHHS